MKINEFNPVRLKSARLYRGKIVDVLAKETEVNKKDILAFEESKYLPKLENAQKLANALDFPIEYFYQKDHMKVLIENVHYAVPGSIPRVDEVAYREQLIMTHKICTFIETHISLPALNLPIQASRSGEVERLAEEVREHWNIDTDAIENLGSIMEENGIIISDINVDKKGVGPFTQKQSINGKLRYFVSLGDDGQSAPRRNFDLAYELGYIVGNMLNIPAKKFSKDEFACALLLPKEAFLYDLKNPNDINSYVALKKKYCVPMVALLFRAHQLGVLGYKPYNNMGREMEKLGWTKNEPLDDTMKAKRPTLLASAIDELVEKEIVTRGDIAQRLSTADIDLNESEINRLLGLKSVKAQSWKSRKRK